MAAEAIRRIKDAEDRAAAKVAEAVEEAKRINRAAQKEGSDNRQTILAEAKKMRNDLIAKACLEAEAESKPLVNDSEAEIAKIKSPSPEKLNKAVSKVIERIVSPVDR